MKSKELVGSFGWLWEEAYKSKGSKILDDLEDNFEQVSKWSDLTESQKLLVKFELGNLKKPVGEFILKHSKHLIGKNVDFDYGNDSEVTSIGKIKRLKSEVILFEGELYGELGVEFEDDETQYVVQESFDDLLAGKDIGTLIKSNYKGASLRLLKNKEEDKFNFSVNDAWVSFVENIMLDRTNGFTPQDIYDKYEKLDFQSSFIEKVLHLDNGKRTAKEIVSQINKENMGKNISQIKGVDFQKSLKGSQELKKNDGMPGYILTYIRPKGFDQRIYLGFDGGDNLEGVNFHYGEELDEEELNGNKSSRYLMTEHLIKVNKFDTVDEGISEIGIAIDNYAKALDIESQLYMLESKLDRSENYDSVDDENNIFKQLESDFGYKLEDNDDDEQFFLRATPLETVKYLKKIVEKIKVSLSVGSALTIKEQIQWLEDFIVRWDKVYGNVGKGFDDFKHIQKEAALQAEYDQFIMDNDLPAVSADELLSSLNKYYVLVGKELIWLNPETNKKVDGDRAKLTVENIKINDGGKSITIIYGPLEGDMNWMSYEDASNMIAGGIANSHEEASFILAENYKGEQVQADMFNDPELFVKEFKDYLVGKRVINKEGDKHTISDVYVDNNTVILIFGGDMPEHLFRYKSFIDGEDVEGFVGYIGGEYHLILQDERPAPPTESSLNKPDFRYYLVDGKTNKIRGAFEYSEDASDALAEEIAMGHRNIVMFNKKTLVSGGVNVDDNNNWLIDSNNLSIIKEALDFGVTEGDYEQAESDNYLNSYNQTGKYASVVKSALMQYLEHAQKHFKKSVVSSQYEKAKRFQDTIDKLNVELLRIIKKDI